MTQRAPNTAELSAPLELTQALLELSAALAVTEGVECLIELVERSLTRCLQASRQRSSLEPFSGDGVEARLATERVRSRGLPSTCRLEGSEPFALLVPIRTGAPPFEWLSLVRRTPFSELEESVAGLAAGLLEAALRRRGLSDELKESRGQLEQSERVKAIGQLASGVAHDFNNLLMVISAAAEVMSDALAPEHPCASHLSLILETSHRAAEVTSKLLGFSRKGRRAIKPVDVHEVLGTVRDFLARGFDRRITLTLSLCDGPCVVDADATQLESAILNVCLNARDAMPEGGLLKITTTRVELDAQACASRFRGCQPGHFVRLDVKDTGTGMDEKTLARAFEPFFTTKAPGRGTGLGLPVVLAAVRDYKGGVLLESEPGCGTSCSILLPLGESGLAESSQSDPASRRMSTLRVLLVDDEPDVCLTAAQLMRQLGHNVQALCSGEKALSHLRVHSTGYDLLVLDVMMPHPTGIEVQRSLAREGIELPTLFMSGFTDLGIERPSGASAGGVFLAKPFRQAELALAIAHCMDAWQIRTPPAVTTARRAG